MIEQPNELANLISTAVAKRLTPEFIEKEVQTRVDKLIVESIDSALRSYSHAGKLIEKSIEDALRINSLDLPSYGDTVCKILKVQIESRVNELVAGRLSADMDELLKLAPKEVKLSEIADWMRERHDGSAYGPVITVEVEHSNYGGTWIYLDEDRHHEIRAQYDCPHKLYVREDGLISTAYLDRKRLEDQTIVGRNYGLAQRIRAFVACGTRIILDEDAVVVSVGDY